MAEGLFRYDYRNRSVISGFSHNGVPLQIERWKKKQMWFYDIVELGSTLIKGYFQFYKRMRKEAESRGKKFTPTISGNFNFTVGAKRKRISYAQWPASSRGSQLSKLGHERGHSISVYTDTPIDVRQLRRVASPLAEDPKPTYRNLNLIFVLNEFKVILHRQINEYSEYTGLYVSDRPGIVVTRRAVENSQEQAEQIIRHETAHLHQGLSGNAFAKIVDSDGEPLFGSGKAVFTGNILNQSKSDFFKGHRNDLSYYRKPEEDNANAFEKTLRWRVKILDGDYDEDAMTNLLMRLFTGVGHPIIKTMDLFLVEEKICNQTIAKLIRRPKARKKLQSIAEYFRSLLTEAVSIKRN